MASTFLYIEAFLYIRTYWEIIVLSSVILFSFDIFHIYSAFADNGRMKRISVALIAGLLVTALCSAQNFQGADTSNFRQEGIASWYGAEFDGRPTASGEVFNSSQYTAAHPTLPFGTLLTVTNLNNGRKVNVRVNDRGPFVSSRIIDLSRASAELLDMVSAGTAPVLVESMGGSASNQGNNSAYQAETDSRAISEGGYSTATSQIFTPPYPPPSYQQPTYQQAPPYQPQPTYQQAPAQQAPEPVVVQVQPPQQQITQYFQQPAQPQQQFQQPQQAQPRQQQVQPPVQQQILPVQQIIQPMQPMVAAPAQQLSPQPAPAAQAAVQAPAQTAAPPQAAPQQVQPLQINIPIEVRPVVTPAAAAAPVAPAAPAAAPTPVAPVAAPAPVAPPVQAVAAPITAPAPVTVPAVKPNKVYRVQVGSYKEARNALAVFERLKEAGLNPVYERNGDYFRVVLSGISSEEVNDVYQKLGTAGFQDSLLREER
jgi:rare lipoprotein A